VATRSVPPPTEAEIEHGIPLFLDQLVAALRIGQSSSPEMSKSALLHGHELLRRGFTVSQVVHDYGDVCQSITELAMEQNAPISPDDFRMLNRCLDDAIAGAVTEFGREQNQFTLDGETARGSERAGFLAHELRNLLHTAIMAFEVLKTGNVGVAGSTGTVLAAVQKLAPEFTRGETIVAISADLGDKYLDTVYNPAWVQNVIAPQAKVLAGE
jgi:signal transduction histidine kinase